MYSILISRECRLYLLDLCHTATTTRQFSTKIEKDLYQQLGVKRTASKKEIKAAYYKKCQEHHPDMNQNNARSHETFVRVQKAYEILSQANSRQAYDLTLMRQTSRSSMDPSMYSNNDPAIFHRYQRKNNFYNYENEFPNFGSRSTKKASDFKYDVKDFKSPLHVLFYVILTLAIFEVIVVRLIYDHDMNSLKNDVAFTHTHNENILRELRRHMNEDRQTELDIDKKIDDIKKSELASLAPRK